jgi:multiple sugar transport system permease protein
MIKGFVFKKESIEARERMMKFIAYIGAVIVGLSICAPIAYMVLCSIVPDSVLTNRPPRLPHASEITVDNYYFILTGQLPAAFAGFAPSSMVAGLEISRTLTNSLIVSLCVTILTVILGAMTGYAFARIPYHGERLTFVSVMATRLLPYISIAIPVYILMKNMGLIDTLLSLILVYTAVLLPWRIWLFTIYFQAIPEIIEETARIDGCGRFKTFIRIVLPISTPGLMSVAIFSFMESFGEFIFALILTSTVKSQTLPVTLAILTGGGLWYSRSLVMAVAVVAALLPALLAIVFKRYVLEGLTAQFGVRGYERR